MIVVSIAGLLIALVYGSPWFHNVQEPWSRVLRLFAEDVTLRRTALASAIGLVVTAFVFFRRPRFRWRWRFKARELSSPQNMAGA